jgi:hypothetical protein
MMRTVRRISPLTGKLNSMELDVTQEQLDELARPGPQRRLVQVIFPNLTDAEREFLQTGYTQEDWDAMFPPGWDEEPRCSNPGGHVWNRTPGEADEAFLTGDRANDNVRCIYCGADGDA